MAKKSSYPDTYGIPVKGTMKDLLSPICMDQQGDGLVPPNDLKALGGKMGDDEYVSPDPLDLIDRFVGGKNS
jgi:hypothetical protein